MIDHQPELQNVLNLLHTISQKVNMIEGTSTISQSSTSEANSDVITKSGTKYTETIVQSGKKTINTWNEYTLSQIALHISQNGNYDIGVVPYYDQKAAQKIVECAKNWWWKTASGEIKFSYSTGGTFLHGGDAHRNLNDGSGIGLIDCSTFASLVMLGYDIEDSPYWIYKNQANIPYTKSQLSPTTAKNSWADLQMFNNHILNDMNYSYANSTYSSNWTAAQMAAYYWAAGRCFFNFEDARDGDIVFHYSDTTYRFKGIHHVSILCDNKTRYYNATNTGNVIVRTNIDARSDVVFYARPFYEPIRTGASTEIDTETNRIPLPLLNTTSSISGVTFSQSNGVITRTNTTAPSSSITPTLFNTTTPSSSGNIGIFLEAGTYSFDTMARPAGNWGSTSSYYIERLFFSGSNISGVRNYNNGTTGNASRSGYPTQLEFRGYGGTFTVTGDGVALYQMQCYMSSNNFASNCPTTWTPIIKRIS